MPKCACLCTPFLRSCRPRFPEPDNHQSGASQVYDLWPMLHMIATRNPTLDCVLLLDTYGRPACITLCTPPRSSKKQIRVKMSQWPEQSRAEPHTLHISGTSSMAALAAQCCFYWLVEVRRRNELAAVARQDSTPTQRCDSAPSNVSTVYWAGTFSRLTYTKHVIPSPPVV